MKFFRSQFNLLLSLVLGGLLLVSGLSAQSAKVLSLDFQAFTVSGTTLIGITPDSAIASSVAPFDAFTQRRPSPTGPLESFYGIASRDTTAIVVGADGIILRSGDTGSSWAMVETPAVFGDLLATVPGVDSGATTPWLAVGDDGLDGVVLSSGNDGATWSEASTITDAMLKDVIWTGSQWVVCGHGFFGGGLVFTSPDGLTWTQATLPENTAPLLELEADSEGNVVAVGEQGAVLLSADHGDTFARISNTLYSGDLRSIQALGIQHFAIGGDDRVVLVLTNGELTEVFGSGGGAPGILDLVVIDDVYYLGGRFEGLQDTRIALVLIANPISEEELSLTLQQSNPSKFYHLERSTDLLVWTRVENTTLGGNGGSISWTVPQSASSVYWRVVEP